MKKANLFILFVLLQSVFFGVRSQEPDGEELYLNHSPKSPTVANLGIFGDIPVSLNTGIPNISVPIGNIREGSLNVPVTIDYHASGIRVSDNSGLVGVKWTINAGGIVSVNHSNQKNNRVVDIVDPTNSEQITRSFINKVVENEWYTQPEGYSYNYSGGSGKFYFNSQEEVLHVPKQPRISVVRNKNSSGQIVSFRITNEKGNRYYFGTSETTRIQNTIYNPQAYGDNVSFTSAYFLDSIVSPQGDKVYYEYENNNYVIWNEHVNSNKYYKADAQGNCEKPSGQSVYRTTSFDSKRLKRIYTNSNKEIVFNYKDNLVDGNGAILNDESGQLDNVVVSSFGKQIKAFDFTYNYNGRFNIERIDLLDSKGGKISDYQFSYIEGTVPDRNSKAVDFFGYYNGQEGNRSWFPNTPVADLDEANRSVYPNYVQVGMLNRVKYPTGGETYFEYESNEVDKSYVLQDGDSGGILKAFEYEDYTLMLSGFNSEEGQREVTGEFEINSDAIYKCMYTQDVTMDLTAVGMNVSEGDPTQDEGLGFQGRIEISGPDSFTLVYDTNRLFGKSADGFNVKEDLCFPKGKYTVKMTTKCKSEELVLILRWKISKPIEDGNSYVYAGGVRLSKLTNILENGKIEEKYYKYENGKLCNAPKYFAPHTYTMTYYIGSSNWKAHQYCNFWTYSTSPVRSIGITNGSYAVYQNVSEYQPGNGGVDYEFTHTDDVLGFESITAPLTSYGYKRGLLKKKEVYKFEGARKKNIRSERNYYNFKDDTNWYGMLAQKGWGLYNRVETFAGLYSYELFRINSSVVSLDSTIINEYNNKTTPIIIKQKFKYNADYHQKIETVTYGSDEQKHKQTIKYPLETAEGKNCSSIFIRKNMLSYPMEIENFVGDTKVTGVLNLYSLNGLKKNILTYNTESKYEEAVQIDYYENGKVKYVAEKNGTSYVLIWAYQGQSPVVKIDNCSFEDVENALGKSRIENLYFLYDRVDIETSLNEIRNLLKNRVVITYTYSPIVGITSQTDPNGITTYYEYDDFGRLKFVKDHESNIIEKINYNYALDKFKCSSITSDISNYSLGNSANFDIIPTGGSGDYSYSWSFIKGHSTLQRGTMKSFRVLFNTHGEMKVKCVVTDKVTGESIEKEILIRVKDYLVKFTNITQSSDGIHAKILCVNNSPITLELFSLSGSGATFVVDGSNYHISYYGSKIITVTPTKDLHVKISGVNSGYAKITIKNVGKGLISSPSELMLRPNR